MVRQNENAEASPTRMLCNCWPAESAGGFQSGTTHSTTACSSLCKNIVTLGGHKKNIMNTPGALTDNFQWLLPVPRKQS